jgi:class 3 adenylate cyclase
VLAAFNTPARAIHAAFDIQEAARALNLPIRAGLHTGECRRDGASVSGIAVDIAVRIASEGGPDDVFASRTVRDLAIGSGFVFKSRGERALKGAPGAWEILAVSAG